MASWCFVYTCLIWFLIFIILILALYSWVASNFFNYDLVHLTYSLNLFCNLSSYLYLAKKWPGIMKYWHQLDQQLELNYGYPGNLTKRINITIHSIFGKTIVHYNDLFIVVIAVALKARFAQISQRIITNKREHASLRFWKSIREDYDRLVRFVQKLNEDLSYIILVSTGFNCFWILKLLYNALKYGTEIGAINFAYSLGFLLFRFLLVFECCTQLNCESKKPSFIIHFSDIPIDNVEIFRLLRQIEFDQVYLSGNNFFRMKNGIILNVAEAIVAYELTLFQYQVFYQV
ncbi:hypothetical protein MTP99_010541 [Tenebrio molitor]|nr:hypothetical protein MTP99_010541 [Tenebrio molitor]